MRDLIAKNVKELRTKKYMKFFVVIALGRLIVANYRSFWLERRGMERLTVNDLDKVCYDPWELCGMDSYCTKRCHEQGSCTKGYEVLKKYKKLAEYEGALKEREREE